MGGGDASQRSAIDANLTFQTEILAAIVEHSLAILANVFWGGHPRTTLLVLTPCIASVVPKHHIDVLLEEEAEVEGMRVVDHVLVEHGIGVA